MSWEIVKLSEVSNFIRNGLSIKQDSSLSGVPITRIETISDRTVNLDKCGYAGLKPTDNLDYKLEKGDILISHINSPKHLGKSAQFHGEEHLIHGMNLLCLRPNDKIDARYLYLAINSSYFLNQLPNISNKSVNQASFKVSDFKNLNVNLPPLPEQQRIADILDKAEAITQKREQALALCDEFLRATFLDMFGDPVSNPKGWDVKKLSRFGEVITGSTPSRGKPEYYGNHIEWIKSDNINTPNNYITRAEEFLSVEGESVGRSVPENSILMTCIAGSLDCIGNIALTDRKVSFNQQINGIVPNDDVDVYFLYSLLLYSKKYIQNHSTNSMKGMISKGKLSEIKFYLPEMAIQKEFSDIFLKIESLRNKIQNAQELPLFDALSQQAFKGELTQ